MKHTDFNSRLDDIKRQEVRELRKALKAHGGSYSWYNDVTGEWQENYPIIPINYDGLHPNPMDINIRSVSINELGHLEFVGEEKEYGNLMDFNECDIFTGHISYITSAIPETNFVTDVSEQQEDFAVPVYISREDLEDIGFDADNISIKDLKNIARCMGDLYSEYNYSEDLKMSAEKLSVPRLNSEKYDEWFGNLDFPALERVTGFIQTDYSPEDGYQDFVDVCDNWWEDLSLSQKKNIYEDNN